MTVRLPSACVVLVQSKVAESSSTAQGSGGRLVVVTSYLPTYLPIYVYMIIYDLSISLSFSSNYLSI